MWNVVGIEGGPVGWRHSLGAAPICFMMLLGEREQPSKVILQCCLVSPQLATQSRDKGRGLPVLLIISLIISLYEVLFLERGHYILILALNTSPPIGRGLEVTSSSNRALTFVGRCFTQSVLCDYAAHTGLNRKAPGFTWQAIYTKRKTKNTRGFAKPICVWNPIYVPKWPRLVPCPQDIFKFLWDPLGILICKAYLGKTHTPIIN